MSEPFKLYRLQQLDSQLDKDRVRLVEIERLLADDAVVVQAQHAKDECADKLVTLQKELHKADEIVRQQRVKIEQAESSLYGGKIHNPKELQDLQNDAASMKRYLIVLEDRLLDAMLLEEEALEQDSASQGKLDTVTQDYENRISTLKLERAEIFRQITNLEGERLATVSHVPSEDISLYEQLRQQRRGLAVSKVNEKACSACGTTLNAALLHAAHLPNQITRCDACGRILYL